MRRLSALVAAGAFVVAACAGGDGDQKAFVDGGDSAVTTTALGGPGTPPGGSDTAATTAGPGTPPPGAGGTGTVTTPPPPTATVTPPAEPGVDTTPVVHAAALGPLGGLAPSLLRADLTERIVVEVLVQPGASPRTASTDYLQGIFRDVSGKQVRQANGTVGTDRTEWTAAAVLAAGDAAAVEQQGNGQAVMRLLFLRGTFEGDGDVLGIALRGDLAAIFVDRVKVAATPLFPAAGIEGAVTVHEAGHILGLVDLYRFTGRQDPEHPGHSANRNSVMYWAIESGLVSDILNGGPPWDYDADDLADLAAIRAGA